MTALHHSLGTSGLRLRTERGVQALALTNRGPLLDGAYATTAELEAAEAGRIATELSLAQPGTLCLALDDGATPVARDPGSPNPRYTLYRIVPAPTDGVEPTIVWGAANRLSAFGEPCDFAQLWQTTAPKVVATLDEPLDSATGWTFTNPKLLAMADYPLDVRTGWTLDPDSVPGSGTTTTTTTNAVDSGANRTYLDAAAADTAAAETGGWKQYLRWWANSNGPFTIDSDPAVAQWHTLWPGVLWRGLEAPNYFRSEGNGKGALSTPDGKTALLIASATPGFLIEQAWTLFVVAKAYGPMQAAQGVLFGAGTVGQSSGANDASLELHCGTATEGLRVVWGSGASRTFSAALSTTALQIVELSAAADSAIGTWELRVNNAVQTQAAVVNAGVKPAPAYPLNQFKAFRGWDNSPSAEFDAPFHGYECEILLIQTDAATPRAAIRSYLAGKFGITLS